MAVNLWFQAVGRRVFFVRRSRSDLLHFGDRSSTARPACLLAARLVCGAPACLEPATARFSDMFVMSDGLLKRDWRELTRIAHPRDTLVTGSGQLEMRPANWRPTQGRWAVVALCLLQWVELTESSVSEPVVEVVCEKASTNVPASSSKTQRGLNFEQGTANTATGKQTRAHSLSAAVATRL